MNDNIQKSPTPTYALCTATGSYGGWWYGFYRLVNDDIETLYTFHDEAFPAPTARQRLVDTTYPKSIVTELVYDPLMLVGTESRRYDPDAIVLRSAERAYLRNLRRKPRKLASLAEHRA